MTKEGNRSNGYRISKTKVRRLTALLLLMRSPVIEASGFSATAKIEDYEQLWGEYYPDAKAMLMEKASCVGGEESWHGWAGEQFRKIMKADELCSVEAIRYAVRLYLKAVQNLYLEYGRQDEDDLYPLTEREWKRMGDAAIAAFLYGWMLTQEEMRKNTYQFSRKAFGSALSPDELSKYDGENDADRMDSRYQLLRKAYGDIKVMQKMREIQAEEEAEGEGKTEDSEMKSDEHRLSYTTLMAMDFIANSHIRDKRGEKEAASEDEKPENRKRGTAVNCFRIFKDISQRTQPLPHESHNKSNAGIASACADYAAVLDQIAAWEEPAVKDDQLMAVKYVVGTLMAKEWEEAFRLHFSCAFAKAERRKGPKKKQRVVESEIAQVLLGRSMFTLGHSIMDYREDIRHICSEPEEMRTPYTDKRILLAGEQGMLFVLLGMLYPPIERPAWSEKDFQDAARFFSRDHNIIKKLCGIKFPPAASCSTSPGKGKRSRRGKDYYDRMQKYYIMINEWRKLGDNHFSSPHDTYRKATEK